MTHAATSSFWIAIVIDRITSGSRADTMVRSSAPMKTGRQTSARIRRGCWCARSIQTQDAPVLGYVRLRRRDGDRFIRAEELDEPAVPVGFGDVEPCGIA